MERRFLQKPFSTFDYLGIDQNGNIVIIELKRGKVPRKALAQAIDYASDVSRWSIRELDEACRKFTEQNLEDFIIDNFPIEEIDWDEISINQTQKILLVGTKVDEKLERMINWLSDNYGVLINALIVSYGITSNGDEVLATSYIVSEDIEKEHAKRINKRLKSKTIEEHREWIKDPKIRSRFEEVEKRIKDLNDDIKEEAKLKYVVFSYRGTRIARLYARETYFHLDAFYQESDKTSKSEDRITVRNAEDDMEPLLKKINGYIDSLKNI